MAPLLEITRAIPFQKGKSGNPEGRKKGATTRIVAELQQVVSADAKEIVRSIVAQAKAGDVESRRAFLRAVGLSRRAAIHQLFDARALRC